MSQHEYEIDKIEHGPFGYTEEVRAIVNRYATAREELASAESELDTATCLLNDLGDALSKGKRWIPVREMPSSPPYPFLLKQDPCGAYSDGHELIRCNIDWYGVVGDNEPSNDLYYWGN